MCIHGSYGSIGGGGGACSVVFGIYFKHPQKCCHVGLHRAPLMFWEILMVTCKNLLHHYGLKNVTYSVAEVSCAHIPQEKN